MQDYGYYLAFAPAYSTMEETIRPKKTPVKQIVCEFAQPLIEEIISFKLRVHSGRAFGDDERDDASDLSNEVLLRLVKAAS